MGNTLFDRFTYLHFCTGAIMYFWGISLKTWFLLHSIFEVFENTKSGMNIINKFTYWPGGKSHKDSLDNIIGDTLGGMLGWLSAYMISNT